MKIEKNSRNVLTIRMDANQGFEQWFLLSSDRHFDSNLCDRELQIRHMDECKKRKALILDFGDFFDAMQGRYDPRKNYPDMRTEYSEELQNGKAYLDVIVQDAVKFLKPYAPLFGLIARGNHETSIQRHNDTDLIDRLVSSLNEKAGTAVNVGHYGGWVRFMFTIGKTQTQSINLKYFHGSGGGGEVTKGTIQSNRQAVILPDAHIVVNGHIHESWILSMARERLTERGVVAQDIQTHLRTGTYKNDYGDGAENWHVERGAPPKPRGAVWLRFYYDRKAARYELIQAIDNG